MNQMTEKLTSQQNSIKVKSQENEKLLHNFIPESLAKRITNQEDKLVEKHSNVTLLLCKITGLEDLVSKLSTDESFDIMNKLYQKLDEQAHRFNVENISFRGCKYLAVCGLHIPRLDHQKRMIEFAYEVKKMINNFGENNNAALGIIAAIHTGDVTGGVLGKEKFDYDIWGESRYYLEKMLDHQLENKILVSSSAKQKVNDLFKFESFNENDFIVIFES
jgi:class 3 adenylate cyclase